MTRRVPAVLAVLFALAVAPLAAQTARPIGDAALLPPDRFLGSWTRVGNPRVYARADLYGYIDGGAELFFEFGFEQLTQQKYQAGPNQIVVDFYRMADPIAATGIYLMKCGKDTPAPAFSERNTINRYQLMWVRDRFFAIVNSVSGAEAFMPDMVKFSSFIASKLPPARSLPLLAQLPAGGLVPDSVRLIRGPYGLQSVYTLGEGDILQLGGNVTAVAGNYVDSSRGAWTRLDVTYPTAAAATAALANLQDHLDPYLTAVSRSPARLVFSDYEKKFGEATVVGAKLTLRLHLREQPR